MAFGLQHSACPLQTTESTALSEAGLQQQGALPTPLDFILVTALGAIDHYLCFTDGETKVPQRESTLLKAT